MTTQQVRLFAKQLHSNHKLKNGKKYFGHLLRVVQRSVDIYYKESDFIINLGELETIKQAAYLHDSLEDRCTKEVLVKVGVCPKVIEVVEILSKNKNEDYQVYLERIKENKIARIVKMADLEHNSKLSRLNLNEPIEKTIERHIKYLNAYVYLK